MKVKIRIKKNLLLSPKAKRYKRELLDMLANDGVLTMEAVTPRGFTGRGAKSYKKENKGENARLITNQMHYLPYVNDGTGIYAGNGPIRPKHASVLHFWVGGIAHAGTEVFAKYVRGQPGQHFVERGARDIAKQAERISVVAARKVFG